MTPRDDADGGETAARMPDRLLAWYDRSARRMPWRVPPGQQQDRGMRPDPYRVWLSEVMLQQTTVAAVRKYYDAFTARWPQVGDLARAPDAEVMAAWAGLGYYARARNLIACARVVAFDLAGRFPDTEAGLARLPGVGPYTAAAVAAIAFDRPAVVLDGNVARVMARIFAVEAPLPGAKRVLRGFAARLTPSRRPGDYAQAVMDLGATICTPRKPACALCPWRDDCAGRLTGVAESLPRRQAKAARPLRRGIAYLAVRRDGAVWLERRAPQGLLGGMLGLPGTAWAQAMPAPAPPFEACWRVAGPKVHHVFTHFNLELRVEVARAPDDFSRDGGAFHAVSPALEAALPSVMRKALRATDGARANLEAG